MKKIVRKGTFETNSSSTHSLTMCLKDDYDKWVNGEVLLVEDTWGFTTEIKKQFVTKEEAIELLKYHYKWLPKDMDWDSEEIVSEKLIDAGFKSCDDYSEDLEFYEGQFTTPNGDVVVAFGEFGYMG
jgi:hypothetical protein